MSRWGAATWERLASAFLVTAVLLIDLWVALRHPSYHGDTSGLVIGAQKIVDCLHHRVFTHCDTWAGGRPAPSGGTAYVGPWPLLQYVPAVVLRWFGLSQLAALRVLIAANALALFVLFGVVWITLRRTASTPWMPVIVVTLLASPLLWYGTSAFGEALGTAVIVAAIVATLLRARPMLVGGLVALASLTKETNPLFVIVLVAVCVLAHTARRPDEKAASRRLFAAAAIGAILGGAANAAFNVLRFGSVRNTTYLQPSQHAPSSAVVGRAFAALWVAPNGGVLWFWPCSLAIIGLTCAGAIWTLRRAAWNWSTIAPLLVAAVLIVEVIGLSTWYSPFGWVAWGPRLLLPLMPAMLLIACVFAGERATHMLNRVMVGRLLWPVGLVTILIGLPNVTVLFQPRVINRFFGPDAHCVNAHVGTNAAAYYRCFDFTAWKKQPFLLRIGLEGFNTFGGKLVALLFVGAVILLLRAARASACRPPVREREGELPRVTSDIDDVTPRRTSAENVTSHGSRR